MPSTAVEVQDLVKRFGPVTAVGGLSFSAPEARVTAVLGPNGAGKTTTLDVCEGFQQADAGGVRVLGCDPWRADDRHRSRVGVMLQEGGVPGTLPPLTALRHAAALHRSPLPAETLVDALGLGTVAGRAYKRLSGGEQRRVLLALALVGRPELVFLDEPSTGLDPQSRLAVWDLLRQLRESGTTLVLTTHDMDEAEALADHLVIVDHGRLLASGSPDDLLTGDDSLHVVAAPGLPCEALASRLGPGALVRESSPGHYDVTGPLDTSTLEAVAAWCSSLGVVPQRVVTGRRSLVELFLDLTGRAVRP